MKKLSIDEIMEMVEGSGHFGVRGLPREDNDKKYKLNQYVAKSYSHCDNEEEEQLDGTSAVSISDLMDEDEIKESIELARKYSSDGRVILVWGDKRFDGMDDGEAVFANEKGFGYRGAKYLGEVR